MLETALAASRLSPADRGLCHELVCGVVRWQATLDCLIARRTDSSRRQRPALLNLLRLGLYQIFWLNRIPAHAAVHETVDLAKRSGYPAQAGFVNALLRGYLREADEIKKILADMKVSQPALGWSHPDWLVTKWRRQFGEASMRRLLEWNNTPPRTFARVNTLKVREDAGADGPAPDASPVLAPLSPPLPPAPARAKASGIGALLQQWREEGVEFQSFQRDWTGENLVFELLNHPPLARLESLRAGRFYLQDPSTLLAPVVCSPQPGDTLLDLCAAPGGKTTFLAQLIDNHGKIVAGDLDPERLKLVKENCARLGATCVEYATDPVWQAKLAARPAAPPGGTGLGAPAPAAPFDRILVDAPCSNTGVMRRRVDLRWRIQPDEIDRLRRRQLDLLDQAVHHLVPGGVLVYSTCSLEPEENSQVVRQFLERHRRFQLEAERQLLPFADAVDGAYVARLKQVN